MSVAAERTLRQAMRDKHFAPVYYFFGEDDFLKEEAVRELAAAAVDVSTRAFDCNTLGGRDVSAEVLDITLNTMPMFGQRRAVVIRDAHLLTTDARGVMDTYLRRPAADIVVILTAPPGQTADQLFLAHSVGVEFSALAPERVPRWITHYAATALDVEISPEAAILLCEAVGADLAAIAGELDKLASFTAGGLITEETVATVVGVRHGESLGDLLDAVATRDARAAAVLAARALEQPKATLVTIVMALATQYLAIGWGGAVPRASRGGNLEREYYALLRESRVYPGRNWSEAVPAWSRAAPEWNATAIDHALRILLAADRAAKDTRVSSDEQVLASLVMGLCAVGEHPPA